jgi:hypothetical protein
VESVPLPLYRGPIHRFAQKIGRDNLIESIENCKVIVKELASV